MPHPQAGRQRRISQAGWDNPRPVTEGEILAAIAALVREKLDWQGALRADQRLVEDLGLDSLRRLTLAVEVENRFRVRLDPEEEGSIETVAQLVAAVRRKLRGSP